MARRAAAGTEAAEAVVVASAPAPAPEQRIEQRRIFDLYQPRVFEANGVTRTVWDRVGVVIDKGDRLAVHLSVLPVGGQGWLQAFPRRPRTGG